MYKRLNLLESKIESLLLIIYLVCIIRQLRKLEGRQMIIKGPNSDKVPHQTRNYPFVFIFIRNSTAKMKEQRKRRSEDDQMKKGISEISLKNKQNAQQLP